MSKWKLIILWLLISGVVFICIQSYKQDSSESLKELKELEIKMLELQIKKLELELQDTAEVYIKFKEIRNER